MEACWIRANVSLVSEASVDAVHTFKMGGGQRRTEFCLKTCDSHVRISNLFNPMEFMHIIRSLSHICMSHSYMVLVQEGAAEF